MTDYQEMLGKNAKPGDMVVLLLSLDDESARVPSEFADLLPESWTGIKNRLGDGTIVFAQGKAREMTVFLLATATKAKLQEEFRRAAAEGRLRLGQAVPAAARRGGSPDEHFSSQASLGTIVGVDHRTSAATRAPSLIYKVEPEHPKEVRSGKTQGTVILRVDVDTDGVPKNIRVERSLGNEPDQKAIEAVKQWRFKPGERDGKPVTVAATIEINFR